MKTLSDSPQRAVATREAERRYDAPDCQAALAEFYGKYVAHLFEWDSPEASTRAVREFLRGADAGKGAPRRTASR